MSAQPTPIRSQDLANIARAAPSAMRAAETIASARRGRGGVGRTHAGIVLLCMSCACAVQAEDGEQSGAIQAVPAPAGTAPPTPEPEGVNLDMLAGIRFGGIIGASIDNALTYNTHARVEPECEANVGVAGASIDLGARWVLKERHWLVDANGFHLEPSADTALMPRFIAAYRWSERHRSPSFWHGIEREGGWFYGGEMDVMVSGITTALQVTWSHTRSEHGPKATLAYGLDY